VPLIVVAGGAHSLHYGLETVPSDSVLCHGGTGSLYHKPRNFKCHIYLFLSSVNDTSIGYVVSDGRELVFCH
jgi:hypothetical protein